LQAATCLAVNYSKTYIIPLWENGTTEVCEWAATQLPQLLACTVCRSAVYLGMAIGPEAEEARWVKPAGKIWNRAVLARHGGAGFFASVRQYRTYAYTVLSYISQFAAPTGAVLATEMKAIQQLTAGPWNAIPSAALCSLKAIGFQLEIPMLLEMARAAMYRVALTSPAFFSAVRWLSDGSDSLDALVANRVLPWHATSIIYNLINNKATMESWGIRPSLDNLHSVQAFILQKLHGRRGDPFDTLILRRAKRWCGADAAAAAPIIRRNLTRLCSLVPGRLAFAVFRTLCNAWCTSRRFQKAVSPCWLCDADLGDDIVHYVDCGALHAFSASHFGDRWWPCGALPTIRRAILAEVMTDTELILTAAVVDTILQSANAARSNRHNAKGWQLLPARWRAIVRQSSVVEKAWKLTKSRSMHSGQAIVQVLG
jgi:transposase InsO family protein